MFSKQYCVCLLPFKYVSVLVLLSHFCVGFEQSDTYYYYNVDMLLLFSLSFLRNSICHYVHKTILFSFIKLRFYYPSRKRMISFLSRLVWKHYFPEFLQTSFRQNINFTLRNNALCLLFAENCKFDF